MRRCARPGCRRPAKPKGDYCKDACRAAAHKLRKKYGDGLLPIERRRLRDREEKRAARASGVIPSDVRLSYAKTKAVLAAHFEAQGMLPEYASVRAERVLREALPERLRGEA